MDTTEAFAVFSGIPAKPLLYTIAATAEEAKKLYVQRAGDITCEITEDAYRVLWNYYSNLYGVRVGEVQVKGPA